MFKSIKKVVGALLGKNDVSTADVRIIHNNDGLHMLGLCIAGAVVFTDGSKHVLVDDYFYLLDDISQRAVLAHEKGHIVLGHMDNLKSDNTADRNKHMAQGTVQPIELEADAYAASIVGVDNMVHALRELLTFDFVSDVAGREIQNRILALMENK